jgi:hypothetical protein
VTTTTGGDGLNLNKRMRKSRKPASPDMFEEDWFNEIIHCNGLNFKRNDDMILVRRIHPEFGR